MDNKKVSNKEDRQCCSVYSRVNGYITPTAQWNDAKQEEFKSRVMFDVNKK